MTVLDTHTWLWWLHDPDRLSAPARSAVEAATATDDAFVSSISVWEIAVKVALDKLVLPMDIGAWYERALTYPGISIDPLDPRDAIASTVLPGELHRDPADRMIVALARRHGAPLVTRDKRLRDYPHLTTIW